VEKEIDRTTRICLRERGSERDGTIKREREKEGERERVREK